MKHRLFYRRKFRNKDFDSTIFFISSTLTILASMAGLFIAPLFKNLRLFILTAIITIILVLCTIIFKKTKKYSIGNRVIISITGMFLFPVIFSSTYGVNSAFPLLMLLIPAAYGVCFRKKSDNIFAAVNLIIFLVQLYVSFKSKNMLDFRPAPYLIIFSISYMLIFGITAFLAESTYKLNNELLRESIVDDLTQIYNRHYFTKSLRTFDYQTVAMFDVDDFKKINDTFGHQEGDKILQKLADILKANSCDEFRPYRWGGEEFVILSTFSEEKTIDMLKIIFDKIRNDLKTPDNTPVTVSCGLIADKLPRLKLIEAVDSNLYVAKNSGKNQLVYKGKTIY